MGALPIVLWVGEAYNRGLCIARRSSHESQCRPCKPFKCFFHRPPFSTMPIYAYKCDSCGHAKDVLQKMSDAPLSDCPECGAPTFRKQLTAAGFQLKGSGWYVTDFRGGDAGAKSPKPADGESSTPAAADTAAAKPAEGSAATTPAAAPAVSKPSPPAATPAASSNSSSKTP